MRVDPIVRAITKTTACGSAKAVQALASVLQSDTAAALAEYANEQSETAALPKFDVHAAEGLASESVALSKVREMLASNDPSQLAAPQLQELAGEDADLALAMAAEVLAAGIQSALDARTQRVAGVVGLNGVP